MATSEWKKPYCQIIKGKITEINQKLLYFQIDQKFRIYIDITRPVPHFPCENDVVEIINPRKFDGRSETAIIGPQTICNFLKVHAVNDSETLEILSVLNANNINEEEIFAMDYILRQLESFVAVNTFPEFLITLLTNAPFTIKDFQGCCLEYKKSFTKCNIKVPSDLNYVNDNSDLYTFIKFDGMCSHNVYPSQSLQRVTDSYTEYLFGILDVDAKFGYFSLSDKTSVIPVKFYTNYNNDLYSFKNSLVMIKKWTVFTEIFEESYSLSLKYILLNVEDVIVINSMVDDNHTRLFYRKNELWDTGQRKTIFLHTVRISEVIYGYNNGPECWIEALISEKDHSLSSRLVYVILTNIHIAIVPFLKENFTYKLFYIEELQFVKLDSYKELKRFRSCVDLYRIGKDTVFQETDKSPVPETEIVLKNFEEVENFVKRNSQHKTFSFYSNISKKVLQDNVSSNFVSWFPKRHDNIQNFGTPGKNKQMRLIFWNSVTNSYMDLYLSDRDNHVTPLGLIDGMKVKVKHVQAYKSKYIKTNIFSSVEILEYRAEIMFSSVNLSFTDRSTWQWRDKTPKTLLGMFSYLPKKCMVHGTFLFQALCCLKIIPVCDRCKKPSVAEMACHSCNISDRDLNVEISMCVQDSINPTFYMDTENKYFLFELLGLKSSLDFKHFSNAFLKIGVLDVNFCDIGDFYACTKDEESKIFVDELVKTIRTQINYNLYHTVDAVCIKQKERESKRWKIIEFLFIW